MVMNYREVVVEDDKTLGDAGTEITELNLTEPITELALKLRVENTSGYSADVPPEITFTKIEIVDGGQTYLSMSGYEAVAAACYDKGFWPPHWYAEVGGASQRVTIPLQFGRFVGDPMFALDATRLRNPQLRVTYSLDADHESGEIQMGVLAKVMEGVAPPGKALIYKEIEEFTSSAEGVKNVDLPVDYPIRRLLVRPFDGDSIPSNIITHHKLDCDVGKLIVFDHDAAEFEDILRAFFGPFQVRKMDRIPVGGAYRQCHMAGRTIANANAEGFYNNVQAWATGSIMYAARITNISTGLDEEGSIQTLITGEFPHSAYCYQFGLKDEEATWFPAASYGEIKLKLTQGVADCTVGVVVQQPRAIP